MSSHCWNCGVLLSEFDSKKIFFRATCDHCEADLHCCQNCKYYKIGLPNDCAVPNTERVSDRTRSNFCEEFSPLNHAPVKKQETAKKKFEDLFK